MIDGGGPVDPSNGKPDWDDCFWELSLFPLAPCPLENLQEIELWIGGSQRGGFGSNFRGRLVHYCKY